jgi:hypothetical protein
MGDNLVPKGLSRVAGFLLQVEISHIKVHEADEPNAVVDLLSFCPTKTVERLIRLRCRQSRCPQAVAMSSRSCNG